MIYIGHMVLPGSNVGWANVGQTRDESADAEPT